MYIIDDICYAGELTDGIKIKNAKPLVGGIILLTFSTGEKRLLDTTLLKGTVFKALDDEKIFRDVKVVCGVIKWDNGKVDIAPETAYELSYPYSDLF